MQDLGVEQSVSQQITWVLAEHFFFAPIKANGGLAGALFDWSGHTKIRFPPLT